MALLHAAQPADAIPQAELLEAEAMDLPADVAQRLVDSWVGRHAPGLGPQQHPGPALQTDWHGMPGGRLLLGMMLCLLGHHRDALPLLHTEACPDWVRRIALVWQARATQRVGDLQASLHLWRAADRLQTLGRGSRQPGNDDCAWAQAELTCGDPTEAMALADGLMDHPRMQPMGHALHLVALLRGGRHADAAARASAWAGSASSADSTVAALQALAALGLDDAIETCWTAACNRLAPLEMRRLDIRVAEVFAGMGRHALAVQLLRSHIAADASQAGAQARLALVLAAHPQGIAQARHEVDLALQCTASATGEDRAWALAAAGLLRRHAGQWAQASLCFRQACWIAPDWWLPRWALAETWLRTGRLTDALDALSHAADLAAQHQGLVELVLQPLPDDPRLLDAIDQRMQSRPLAPALRQCLLRALGAARLRQGDQRRALAHLAAAADLPAGAGQFWRPAAHRAGVDDVLALFSRQRVAQWEGWGHGGSAPVFVMGLPEAGQDRLVQAMRTHLPGMAVDACGTVEREIGRLVWRESDQGIVRPFPDCLAELTQDDASCIAARWIKAVTLAAPNASLFVDCGSLHAGHIGFIKLIFPAARIIWCQRDQHAHALALHGLEGSPRSGQLAWLHRLGWIGAQLVDQARLIDHWKALYGADLLVVPCGELCRAPGDWMPAVLAHVGCPGVPDCDNERVTWTPLPGSMAVDPADPLLTDLLLALRQKRRPPLPLPLPELPPGLLHQAQRALNTGRLTQAEQALRRLLEVQPDHAAAHHHLGRTLSLRHQPRAAWHALRQSVRLQPQQVGWYDRLQAEQHAVLATGLDQALLLLAAGDVVRGAALVEALFMLQSVSTGWGHTPPQRGGHGVLALIASQLADQQLAAWPMLGTLNDLLVRGRLPPHRRHAMLGVATPEIDTVLARLLALGFVLRKLECRGARLLVWPARQFSLVLLPRQATDTPTTNLAVGQLCFRVPQCAQPVISRIDQAATTTTWQRCEALALWLDDPHAPAGAAQLRAMPDQGAALAIADSAMAAWQSILQPETSEPR